MKINVATQVLTIALIKNRKVAGRKTLKTDCILRLSFLLWRMVKPNTNLFSELKIKFDLYFLYLSELQYSAYKNDGNRVEYAGSVYSTNFVKYGLCIGLLNT